MSDNDRPDRLTATQDGLLPLAEAAAEGVRPADLPSDAAAPAAEAPPRPPKPTRKPQPDADADAPERRCILAGDRAPKDRLIRLALGPDGSVAPDVRARAPGRGAWIGVNRETVEAALAKGRLKGALYRAFKTQAVTIPDDLPAQIEAALQRDALDRLGLEARSGTLLTGSDKITDSARRGAVTLLLHAADAGVDGNRKLDQALRVGRGAEGSDVRGVVIPAGRAILSMALGRENVVHIALITPAAAARVTQALSRWRGFIGRDWVTEPCDEMSQGPTALED